MKALERNIEKVADRIGNTENAKEAYHLAKCIAVMTGAWIHTKEVEIHEKYHTAQDTLPGEDLGGFN